ncbi:FAD-dependent oxidoreductase [Gemmatimonas sp.]|uniref:flavin monoamine oxidase family protein n=1 Tax=Gemmatimonas sp. TaxID=1962908 RepID=UPI00286E8864|nr:FAD-dependent oxidoreductase [Gemmatimonas sp.]
MRTPLLQFLSDALAEAANSGSPPKGEGERSIAGRTFTRRAFVGAAGLTTGALVAGCRDLSPTGIAPTLRGSKTTSTERVVVIGAGLAGLTCAWRLKAQGIAATVYEANTRLGGRCWSNRAGFGAQIAEHGGELIDQGHTAIRHLAQELGLVLDNVLAAEANGTELQLWFDGAPYSYRQAVEDLKAVWQPLKRDYVEAGYPTLYTQSTARGRELDALSIRDWIATRVPGGMSSRVGKLLDVAYNIEYGAESTDQAALNLVYLLGGVGQGQLRLFGPSNEKSKVRGGNDQLVARMAAGLSGQVETSRALIAVRATGSRWTLDFDGGAPVLADRVVLALPFSVLRERVDIGGANFPEVKRRAIAELGMGRNAKLALQFNTRHWRTLGGNGDSFSDRGYQATWEVTRAQPGAKGILVNYTGGNVTGAQSGRLSSALATEFLTRIEPVMPGLTAAYTGVSTFDDWPRNPWSLGSYSYYRVGQYTRFAGAEGEVVGSCHFCGEHTSIDAQGYLEGAVESGERAAREILAVAR